MVVKVDMQSFTARCLAGAYRNLDQAHTDPLTATRRSDDKVLYPCMDETVQEDVDEPNERAIRTGHDLSKTVSCYKVAPVDIEDVVLERVGRQLVRLVVGELTSPHELDFSHSRRPVATKRALGDLLPVD